ncbi:class I SAM-dependent methyltransferase [Mucilaginibacter sp. R-33]|uniref:class I SAM-dependent methyltransferase n=1 Tax=unclassified Mucilaginibacter TaxID=2617802 RepID=UPI003CFABE2F
MNSSNLRKLYGNIDIYLFDQLLKGRFDDCRTILDAGCGNGRNIPYFLQNGFSVYGIDQSEHAVELSKRLSAELCPDQSPDNFKLAAVENLPFEDEQFDLVICSAVLHFANDAEHFDSMLRSLWRVLKPGGYFFARLASDIGIETLVRPLGNYRYLLPDGSERFLVNEEILLEYTRELGAQLYEPIKTTNVQNLRCMTTWCMQKQ